MGAEQRIGQLYALTLYIRELCTLSAAEAATCFRDI